MPRAHSYWRYWGTNCTDQREDGTNQFAPWCALREFTILLTNPQLQKNPPDRKFTHLWYDFPMCPPSKTRYPPVKRKEV